MQEDAGRDANADSAPARRDASGRASAVELDGRSVVLK